MMFRYYFSGEELRPRAFRPELTRVKFQKEHGRERCAVGKEFGIVEGQFGHDALE